MKVNFIIIFGILFIIIVGCFFVLLLSSIFDGIKEVFTDHPIISISATVIIVTYFSRNNILNRLGLEIISFSKSPFQFLYYKLNNKSLRYKKLRELFDCKLGSEYDENEFKLSLNNDQLFNNLCEHFDFYNLNGTSNELLLGIIKVKEDVLAYNGDILSSITCTFEGNQIHSLSKIIKNEYLENEKYDIDSIAYKVILISKNEVLTLIYFKERSKTIICFSTIRFFDCIKQFLG